MFEKLKNIAGKIDSGIKFFIIIMFIISIFYVIFVAIFPNDKNQKNLNYNDAQEFVNIYLDSDSDKENKQYLVKGYSEYYTVVSAVDNFVKGVYEEKYNSLYSLLDDTLKKEYSQKSFKNELAKFDSELLENFEDTIYVEKVYLLSDYQYVCELKYNEFNAKLGVRLNINDDTYKVFYLKIGD